MPLALSAARTCVAISAALCPGRVSSSAAKVAISPASPVMVSLNPQREPAADKVIAEFDYAHPLFDAAAIAAQGRLAEISGQRGVWFCGAWNGYGFHEDGLKSALRVVNGLGVMAPWQGAEAVTPVAETA